MNDPEPADVVTPERSRPSVWSGLPLSGVAGALVGAWLILTPSLLPRPALLQGVLCALGALIGYGVAGLVRHIGRRTGHWPVGVSRGRAWAWIGGTGALATVLVLWWYAAWTSELRRILGMEPTVAGHVTAVVASGLVLFAVFLIVARLLRALGRRLGGPIGRILPPAVASLVAALVVTLVAVAFFDNVVTARIVKSLDQSFALIDTEYTDDVEPPSIPEVSAGPGSLVGWKDLGRQGRIFIHSTPTAADVASFTGTSAVQPIRVYVGHDKTSPAALKEQATTAVAELRRTGAFDRAVLNVVTGTGRGWVNENQAQAVEYMFGGDTATVSMQYSHLPSWLSLAVDGERARDAARALFSAVYEAWAEEPADTRPKLVVSGESLGSFGGEAAFSSLTDMAQRTDGALFVGPTGNNTLWQAITQARDPGTREVMPTFQGGATVRFAEVPDDWTRPGPWEPSRIGYLQHANDPITWWTWSLAWNKPDWLREERGRNVLSRVRWIPLVTMLQLGADNAVANAVPPGTGHQFGQEPVYAWAEILQPPGWDRAASDRLAAHLAKVAKNRLG